MDLILIRMMTNIYGINSSTLNHYILSSNSLFSLVQLNNLCKPWNLKQCVLPQCQCEKHLQEALHCVTSCILCN